jgi:acetoacetyl-CoA synthetase
MTEGELLWTPDPANAEASTVARFMRWLAAERGRSFATYEELRRWSVTDLDGFWAAVWDFFEVQSSRPYERVVSSREMPGAVWFAGSRVNYAEHLLRHELVAAAGEPALVHSSELRPLSYVSWSELGASVRVVATRLRELGVRPGDRVAAYMPNIPETVIAMLAVTAIGAVWSSAAPEFGVRTVIDRFAQIEPSVLFVADGYRFGGKDYDRAAEIRAILAELPSVRRVVWLPYLNPGSSPAIPDAITWAELLDHPPIDAASFAYERVAEDHPLWVLFSSGTTGLPKPIVHGHVGTLVEHLKSTGLGQNLSPSSRMFFYTTTGWMMFNALVSALVQGASIVLYDGHPAYPTPALLWQLAADAGATSFGASPTFVQMMQKIGLVPRERFDLSRLESVLLTGSPVTPESTAWFYDAVKSDLWVTSPSGGTELCAGLVGGSPLLPVYAGEIQTRLLGMDVHAWNDAGEDVVGEVGELVVTSPSPSMPLRFMNDPGDARYRETYFEHFPGVWRHGDFIKINERGGCYIYGRSDSTLNRYGVRIGSAEIYRAVEQLDEIADSLIVCLELPGGAFYMPLFVRLSEGATFDDALRERVVAKLRTDCSPRHVPDEIHAVAAIPYTLTGKKMEIPVRRILAGTPPEKAASREAMMDPAALDWFIGFASRGAVLRPSTSSG